MQIRIFLLISLMALITACSPLITSTSKASNTILQYKMKEAFQVWDANATKKDYTFLENNHTYIEEGLRYNYAILKNLASIAILEKAIGEKIFLSGPHQEELDFYANNSFGYYNPVFWEKVKTVVAYSLKNDGVFKRLGKYVYDQHLKKESQLYYDSYSYLKDNENMTQQVKKDYQATMKNGGEAGLFLQDAFRPFANSKEQLGENWYVANTAPGFWVRRQIDGTAEQVFEILELVRAAYEE